MQVYIISTQASLVKVLALDHPSNQLLAMLLAILFPHFIQGEKLLSTFDDGLDINLTLCQPLHELLDARWSRARFI